MLCVFVVVYAIIAYRLLVNNSKPLWGKEGIDLTDGHLLNTVVIVIPYMTLIGITVTVMVIFIIILTPVIEYTTKLYKKINTD